MREFRLWAAGIGAVGCWLALAAEAPAATPATSETTLSQRMTERDLYRAQLIWELNQKEQLLARQTREMEGNAALAKKLYDALVEASKKPADAEAAGGDQPLDVAKTSLDFEALTYTTNVARSEVVRTTQEIADLRVVIARISKPLTVKP